MKFALLYLLLSTLFCGCARDIDASAPLISERRSSDMKADIQRMWETQPLIGRPSELASTERAVEAADRVFSTAHLDGMTQDQVIAFLGDPKRSTKSTYNFPFYPAPQNALVYRFDTGSGGWQFNVICDKRGLVRKVQRYGIE